MRLECNTGLWSYFFSLFFFWTGLCGPIAFSLLGGGVPTHNSGYMYTRLFPYIVLVYYRSTPCLQSRPGVSSYTAPSHHLYSSPSYSTTALSFDPSRAIPSFSHYRQDTQAPSLRTYFPKKSRIDCFAIHCATVLFLLAM